MQNGNLRYALVGMIIGAVVTLLWSRSWYVDQLSSLWHNHCVPLENEELSYSIQRGNFGLTCVYRAVYGRTVRMERRDPQ